MKRLLLVLVVCLSFASIDINAQAKKPTIMVMPSDVWCNQNGYMIDVNVDGVSTKVPDYKKALQGSSDLIMAISKINELMASRGFPLKNLESVLKSLEKEAAEEAATTSKTSGASLSESPVDMLKKAAKADIIMQITWSVNTVGPKKSVSFVLSGLDSYTDKQVAGASGTGNELIGATLPVMLETAVLAHMDNFNTQLQAHFEDLFANGREIVLRVKRFASFASDFETEFDGDELGVQIENWVREHTVKNRFSTTDATENMMLFEQVRIPLNEESGRAIDARSWSRGLQKYLKDTYKIDSKLVTKGLGQVTIIVGEK